jgi:tetratricopeptide (TPR) repeat protein
VSYTVPTAYINLAVLYILQGENEKAEKVLQDYIAIYSQDALGYKLLGDIYLRRNFYLSAIENYKKAIEIDPSFTQAYNGIALAYDYLGYYSTALEMAQKAYRLKPSDEIVLYNLAKILRDNRDFEQALSILLKLQKLNPEFPFLNESLAEVYILLGRKEEAERFLEQEIAETKHFYQKYADRQNLLKLVYLYFMKKDYRSAQGLIEKAMEKGNDFPELHYFYGKIWEEEGNLIQASKEYEKAIRSRFGELARERYYQALLEQKLK